jgi:hypothetical protein
VVFPSSGERSGRGTGKTSVTVRNAVSTVRRRAERTEPKAEGRKQKVKKDFKPLPLAFYFLPLTLALCPPRLAFTLLLLYYAPMNLNFLSALSPLATLVLLVFLFGIAVVVALWSLLTLGGGPRGVATKRVPKREKQEFIQPVRPNRFMRRPVETSPEDNDLESELPTDHVSQSRVKILKTLEPDPDIETPQFKPTTYDQMVNRQRVPKTLVPKPGSPKPEALNTGLPKNGRGTPGHGVSEPTLPPRRIVMPQPTPTSQPTPKTPLRTDAEDTSTQPPLFETNKRRNSPLKVPPIEPPHIQAPQAQTPQTQPLQRKPSVQRQESEAAFRATQGQADETPPKPKTQKEKDDAFEKFLRKNDDLSL